MSAGQVGCVETEVEISDTSSGSGSETWIATCNGERYVCSKVRTGQVYGGGQGTWVGGSSHQVNCAPEGGAGNARRPAGGSAQIPGVAAPSQTQTEPPDGAAGFEFGETIADASRVCSAREYAWEELEAARFRCTGMPEDIGMSGHSVLSFCRGQLCAIELVMQPATSGKTFAGSFVALSEALDGKYGTPEKRVTELPSACKEAPALVQCLKEGRARFLRSWAWASGERITMTLGGQAEEEEPALRIVYTRRPSGFRPKTDAL